MLHSGTFVQQSLQRKSYKYYIFWVCVCSLRYPACNAHVPYCHLWPAPLYSIFPHHLINGTISWRKLSNVKCVFWLSLQFLSETFLILHISVRYYHTCTLVFVLSTRYSCQIFKKFGFVLTFSKILVSNFMKICPVGAELFHLDIQTDRHNEANICFSKFLQKRLKMWNESVGHVRPHICLETKKARKHICSSGIDAASMVNWFLTFGENAVVLS